MLEKVRKCKSLATIYWVVRLPSFDCSCCFVDFLSAWWSFPKHWHIGSDQTTWQSARSSPRRPNLRSTLVRPRWQVRLGHQPKRCRLLIWPGHFRAIQPFERPDKNRSRSPTCDERLQLVTRKKRSHCLLCPQLLLQMRKWGCHHGSRWVHEVQLPSIWPGSTSIRDPKHQSQDTRLLPLSK